MPEVDHSRLVKTFLSTACLDLRSGKRPEDHDTRLPIRRDKGQPWATCRTKASLWTQKRGLDCENVWDNWRLEMNAESL
jgi:hypothetical protein